MYFYYAGNFINMGNPEIEKKFIQEVKKKGQEYNRLSSFFFKETQNLLNIKKGTQNEDK